MKSWQIGASVALAVSAIVAVAGVFAGAPWFPTHLLMLSVAVAVATTAVVALGSGCRQHRVAQSQVVTLGIGCMGSLLFLLAQDFALPPNTLDHRDLDCALTWMTLALIANAVSAARENP